MHRLVESRVAAQCERNGPDPRALSGPKAWLLRLTDRLGGIHHLRALRDAVGPARSPIDFAERALELLGVDCELDSAGFARIPRTGSALLVANHPLGALDELVAIAVLGRARPDLRVFASSELLAMSPLASVALPAPTDPRDERRGNAAALRQAVRWLASDRAVLAFPARDVARYDLRARCVTDAPWSPVIGRLVQLTDTQVVPIHLSAPSGVLYPAVGVLAPRLRRFLRARELQRQRGTRVIAHVGAPIAATRLSRFNDNEAATVHLRVKTLLATSRAPDCDVRPTREWSPTPETMPRDALAAEIAALPPSSRLLRVGDCDVHIASAGQIPHVLSEIGRLRELTFRESGGGSGRPRDLDRFDRDYEHVVLWNLRAQRVLGACRLGRIDELRARFGPEGLHCATRFRFRDPALRLFGAALEIDRPFVRADVPDPATGLGLLWKGVGEVVAREPRYCRLLGLVTVGSHYCDTSKELLVGYLRRQRCDALVSKLVRPRRALDRSRPLGALTAQLGLLSHADALDALIEDLEADAKGIPPVLRQYLRLGGRVLALGAADAGAIDCLLLIDLRHSKPRALQRFMGHASLDRFAGAHALRKPAGLSSNRAPSGAAV